MIAVDNKCWVASQFGISGEGTLCWNTTFFRSLREWELESIDMFLELLYANNLPFGMEKIISVGGFLKMEGSRFVLRWGSWTVVSSWFSIKEYLLCLGAYRSIILWMHSCFCVKYWPLRSWGEGEKLLWIDSHMQELWWDGGSYPLLHCHLSKELWLVALIFLECIFWCLRLWQMWLQMLEKKFIRHKKVRLGKILLCILWIIWLERSYRTFSDISWVGTCLNAFSCVFFDWLHALENMDSFSNFIALLNFQL